MLVGKYFPVKTGKIPRVADSSGPGGCGIKEGMMGGDEGFPLIPRFGMELGWSQAGPAPRASQSFTSHLAEQNF